MLTDVYFNSPIQFLISVGIPTTSNDVHGIVTIILSPTRSSPLLSLTL